MTGAAGPQAVRRGPTRRAAVLLALLLGVLAATAGSATWLRSTTSSVVQAEVVVEVGGRAVAPGVSAGALVVAASALALSLGGRWGRRLAGVGVACGGLLVLVSAVGGLGSPSDAAADAAREAVGVAVLTGPVTVTAWPWVTVATGALATALGAWATAVSGRWERPVRRYERTVAHRDTARDRPDGHVVDEQDAWDTLDRGQDPS